MYMDTVLGPWWQTQKNSSDDRMLLVCDNASVHTADDLKEKLDQHGIILRFLPPNMTQWLQPLDLVVCGLVKTVQRARRGKHLATDLRNWRDERDRIVGRAVLAQQQPPPLEPWKPRNSTISQGIFFYHQTHNEELVDARTQAAIRKAFVDAGITPMKPGVWKKYVQSSFMSLRLQHARSYIRCASCKTQGPSAPISSNAD
jgi:hypothetical protein